MKPLIVLTRASLALASGPFNWDAIEPTRDLRYTPCYDGFECARLLMPLDWLDNDNAETVAIAMIKLPASVPSESDSFGGTVILNPGGPGDSGVVHILRNARYIQNMMDARKHYEILSFDPRGMFHSTPIADCNVTAETRAIAEWQGRGLGSLDTPEERLKYHKALATANGLQCAKKGPRGYAIQEFMSTASVARDMLRMVDEIARLDGQSQNWGSQRPLSAGGLPRLQYYGTSYGTVLGNTFMSMFPGRVRRMILDGVVVASDWVNGDWSADFADTTQTINFFYSSCFEANCALRKDSDGSWRDIRARVTSVVDDLDANPVGAAPDGGPALFVTGDDVRGAIFERLYSPIDFFGELADLLVQAVEGNYTLLLKELVGQPPDGSTDGPEELSKYSWMGAASPAVFCGDAKDMRNYSMEFWVEYTQRTKEMCPELGGAGATEAFICSGWQVRPKDRFEGPFGSPEADSRELTGRPSAPLLLLSSLHDPITPLASARRVSKSHPGSKVLVQNGVGHCTLLSGPSECTRRNVQAYMENGTMPAVDECEQDCMPWKPCRHERAKLPR